MARKCLDLASIEAFVLAAELRSFTQAAEALNMTQSAISLRLGRLENQIGRRLLNRTPRSVQLSPDGETFLRHARTILSAQQQALLDYSNEKRTLRLALTDHAAGPELPQILDKMRSYDPSLAIKVRVGLTGEILREFEASKVDAAVVRRGTHRRDGEVIFQDHYGWYASPSMSVREKAIPLLTVHENCGIRETVIHLLDEAGIPWDDAFIGGGVSSTIYAAEAGIGIAPLPQRLASPRLIDVSERFGLPPIASSEMSLLVRKVDTQTRDTLRLFISSLRILGGRIDNPQWNARTEAACGSRSTSKVDCF